jgi:Ca2+-binding EF-hand superfamily protein
MRAILRRIGLAIPLALALCAWPAGAQSPSAPVDTERLRQWFQSVDRNGDGRIDRGEFHEWAVERFFFLDKTRKGYLTLEDLEGRVGPEAFKVANRKGDGRLSLQEFVNSVFKDFEAADADKDGTLTFEEVVEYVRRTRQ